MPTICPALVLGRSPGAGLVPTIYPALVLVLGPDSRAPRPHLHRWWHARCWPGDLVARPMHHGHTFTARARQAVTWCHGLPGARQVLGLDARAPRPHLHRWWHARRWGACQVLAWWPVICSGAGHSGNSCTTATPSPHGHAFGVSGFCWLGAVGAAGSRRWPGWQPTRHGYTFTTWARLVRWPGGRDSKRA